LLLVVAGIALWIAPADGYQLELVDRAHPVAPLVHIVGKHASGRGTIYFVDVRERPARLIERLLPWARTEGSSLVRSPPISSSLDRRLGQVEMLGSQKIAPYVALKLLGANSAAGFSRWTYGVTDVLLAPFRNLLPTIGTEQSVLEMSVIVAILVYALIGWALARLMAILFFRNITVSTRSGRLGPRGS